MLVQTLAFSLLPLLLFLTNHASIVSSRSVSHMKRASSWPNGPFTTNGRYINDASGNIVTYAGVNWPGAADTMLPEGLQYQSIASIVSKIKGLGMNVVRLTYAIELVDDIYSGADSTLATTLSNALGATNGSAVLKQVLQNNPQFNASTTRLEVFDAVAAECAAQEIFVHLDNHVSKAEWCCSHDDGNAWWGDEYFNITNWTRGLAYMASHAASWPALVSMSLRNEPRYTDVSSSANATYGWPGWYQNVVAGAKAISAANPAPLIFFSGLNYDTDLSVPTTGSDLDNGQTFSLDDFPSFKDKIVWELHNYDNGETSCQSLESALYAGGYNAMNTTNTGKRNIAPVVMTEFGFPQNDTAYEFVYSQCLKSYLTAMKGGWMQWVLAGSYYIRQGTQDEDETWGLLSHDWSSYRSQITIDNYTKPMVQGTLN